jgi:hypothetical protein
LAEAQRRHQAARDAVASLGRGTSELAAQLTFADQRLRHALVAVVEDEGVVARLLAAYDRSRVVVEQIAKVLRFLEPNFVSPGWEHPDRPIPAVDGSFLAEWRTALAALEAGEIETILPEIDPGSKPGL